MCLAREWVNYCVDHHDCSESFFETDSGPLASPSRLLDLKAFTKDCLDLQLTEEPVPGCVYATLSHCWGSNPDPRHQTTTSSLQHRKRRIPYTDLPATFRDTVLVCHALGVRYLWIDSFCIIQDSIQDWTYEASRMAYIYSNSHLTISADWSPNSEGGCFPVSNNPQGIDAGKAICITNILSDGHRSSLYIPLSYSPSYKHLNTTHLSGRAWAYQERFLSRRILHFTQSQLFWECREGFTGEDLLPRRRGSLMPAFVLQMRASGDIQTRVQMWCTWVINSFSMARLTVPTDRLPAISALARLFSEDIQSPYLAGLWLEGLWYTLSWYVDAAKDNLERPKEYIAPSWSWASVNTGVQWMLQVPRDSIKQRVKIEDAVVKYGLDPFGQISYGWIRVTGRFGHNIPLRHPYASTFADRTHLDYPQEASVETVEFLLLGEQKWDEKSFIYYFLLVVINNKDLNEYKRYGMASRLLSEQVEWSELTITII
jgi:Heterokaryon incompatibility protein (HET)